MTGRNPQTIEEARAFVAHIESLKELRGLAGDTIANYWEGEWRDAVTGKEMTGRGVEIWVMRDGKVAVWEAAFNFNENGKPSAMGLT